MRAGLLALPWLQAYGDRPASFDCVTCQRTADDTTRAILHCGWDDRATWAPRAELPPAFGPYPYEADVCPGWAARLPAVAECAQAFTALKGGALAVGFPDISSVTWDGLMLLDRASNAHEAEQAEKRRKG